MELALRGVSAAPGVVFGAAVVLDRVSARDATVIPVPERGAELDRALKALDVVASELQDIVSGLREAGRNADADIVETGVLMAADPGLVGRVDALVMTSGRPASEALREAADESAQELAQLADPVLSERADDVRSLRRARDECERRCPGRRRCHRARRHRGPLAWNADGCRARH